MNYISPDTNLLKCNESTTEALFSMEELSEMANDMEQYFDERNIQVKVTDISLYGGESYLFEIELARGTRVNSVTNHKQELSVLFKSNGIDFLIPVPGKTCLGIIVTYTGNRGSLLLGDIIRKTNYLQTDGLKIILGRTLEDKFVIYDFEQMPHLLIAGTTGSGKSVFLDSLLISLLYKFSPEELRFILVDTHSVSFSMYKNIPHLLMPVITDAKKVRLALNWLVSEMKDRYKIFSEAGVRNIDTYNEKSSTRMSRIMVVLDDLADVMSISGSETEDFICKLSQMSRAAGIHLVISTQRPTTNVITGLIKANMPNRIAMAMAAGVDSRTILDEGGAEKLKGKGEMLFKSIECREPIRIQGPYIADSEIDNIVADIKMNNSSFPTVELQSQQEKIELDDELLFMAGVFVIRNNKASIGAIQREYKIGFNRAARIMDQLHEYGVVGDEIGTSPRKILMNEDQFGKLFSNNKDEVLKEMKNEKNENSRIGRNITNELKFGKTIAQTKVNTHTQRADVVTEHNSVVIEHNSTFDSGRKIGNLIGKALFKKGNK